MQPTRRLAAILFTDIVGSTSMMQKDEQVAVAINKRYVAVLKEFVLSHDGEILNDFGDGSLCTFSSATQAVRCAVEIQKQFQIEPKVPLRIGLHVGEIFFEDGKVFGDGVNVASRVQSLGIANSILFSSEINSKIKNQQEFKCVSVGRFHFKNVDEPMEVFALANEGLIVPKRENMEGKLKESKKNSSRKKRMLVAVVISLLVISFILYKQFFNPTVLTAKEKSIAILPFANMSNNKDNEYFSDGMTDVIISKVSKIPSLKVISHTSVMQYKNSSKPLKQIAKELGVAVILEGGIQRSVDSVRINARLIDATSEENLWAENYDRNIKELFAIQSEVAQNIAEALKTKLTPQEKRNLSMQYTENVEAYKFYRKGRYLWDLRTKESYDSAEVNYKHAIDLDPDYALAYSGLADLYIYPMNGLPPLKAIPIARAYASKALLLDSTLGEALTTIGFIQSYFDNDWARAKNTLEKAIRLNPNYPIAHMYYGNLLQYTGENAEQGIKEIKKALELDPLSLAVNYVLGRNYYLAGKIDAAYEQLKKTITLYPKTYVAKWVLIEILLLRKHYPEVLELIKQLPQRAIPGAYVYQGPYLSYVYALMGDTTRAKKELEKTIAEDPDQSPYLLVWIYIILKNYNEALNMLEEAYKVRDIRMYWVNVDPNLAPIRNQPRYIALLKKMHLD